MGMKMPSRPMVEIAGRAGGVPDRKGTATSRIAGYQGEKVTEMGARRRKLQVFMGVREVAAHTGLSENTIKFYAREGWMPEPDAVISSTRGWSESTIDEWRRGVDARRAARGSAAEVGE